MDELYNIIELALVALKVTRRQMGKEPVSELDALIRRAEAALKRRP